jgi:predicted metal-dependent hydrolase
MKIRVIKSKKRRKTASARLEGEVLHIRVPVALSDEKVKALVEKLKRSMRKKRKLQGGKGQEWLVSQAEKINQQYFGGKLRYKTVKWSKGQKKIFGSCTSRSRSIRISARLTGAPKWVLDYVLLHELAHLIEPNHSKAFWGLVNQYKRAERARGYLMGLGFREGNSDGV